MMWVLYELLYMIGLIFYLPSAVWRRRLLCWTGLAALVWGPASLAEVIHLKNGKTVEARITQRTPKSVVVDWYGVPITYWLEEVDHIDGDATSAAALATPPGDVTPAAPGKAPTTPSPSAIREEAVVIGQEPWRLSGTLTRPAGDGPAPAVVFVHGSGPHDRDETIGPNKPFRDLAFGLGARGIAVLRYEKRTKTYGAQFAALKDYTINDETVDDALAAVAALRQTPGMDPHRIFVLGHSVGGMMAPRIAMRDRALAGLVLLAGNSRPIEDLILEQTAYLASLQGSASAVPLEALRHEAMRVKALPPPGSPTTDAPPLGIPLSYWRDLQGYQPAEVAKSLSLPILILQGERDYQVTMSDFEGWKRALQDRSNAGFRSYPTLNHLFIEGSGKSTPAEYAQAGQMADVVINDIAAWIASH